MTFKLLPYVFIIFLAFQVNFLQCGVVELPVSYYIFDTIGNLHIFLFWSHWVKLSVSGNLHIFFFDLTEWSYQYQVICTFFFFDLTEWSYQYQVICTFFSLISLSEVISINKLALILKISHCKLKPIMTILIKKTITSALKVSTYITKITARSIGLTAILAILSVSTFTTAVIL